MMSEQGVIGDATDAKNVKINRLREHLPRYMITLGECDERLSLFGND